MKTIADISHAIGWRALANHLSGIGIPVSWMALETRARRYGLPTRGRGVRGREIIFSRDDIETWVLHLTGLRLDAWLSSRSERQAGEPPLAPRPRRRVDRHRHLESVLQFPVPLYAVTTSTRAHGEQIVRRGGALFASTSTESLADFDPEVVSAGEVGFWRYDVARIATPADLHGPRLSAPQRHARAAVRLVGALVPSSPEWKWVSAPESLFGGAENDVQTRFLAADALPGFSQAILDIRTRHSDVAFVTWTRRVAVTPVLFEPLGPPAVDVEALIDRL